MSERLSARQLLNETGKPFLVPENLKASLAKAHWTKKGFESLLDDTTTENLDDMLADERITDGLGNFSVNGAGLIISERLIESMGKEFEKFASFYVGEAEPDYEFTMFKQRHPDVCEILLDEGLNANSIAVGIFFNASLINTIKFYDEDLTSGQVAKVIDSSREDIGFLLKQSAKRVNPDMLHNDTVNDLPQYREEIAKYKQVILDQINYDLFPHHEFPNLNEKLEEEITRLEEVGALYNGSSEELVKTFELVFGISLDDESENTDLRMILVQEIISSVTLGLNNKARLDRITSLLTNPEKYFTENFDAFLKIGRYNPQKVIEIFSDFGVPKSDTARYIITYSTLLTADKNGTVNTYFDKNLIHPSFNVSGELDSLRINKTKNSKGENVLAVSAKNIHFDSGVKRSEIDLDPYFGCVGRMALSQEAIEKAHELVGNEISEALYLNSPVYIVLGLLLKLEEMYNLQQK